MNPRANWQRSWQRCITHSIDCTSYGSVASKDERVELSLEDDFVFVYIYIAKANLFLMADRRMRCFSGILLHNAFNSDYCGLYSLKSSENYG